MDSPSDKYTTSPPWRTVFLDSLLPGLGHIDAGFRMTGCGYLAIFSALLALCALKLFKLVYDPSIVITRTDLAFLKLLLFGAGAVYILCLVDAYIRENRLAGGRLLEENLKQVNYRWLASTLSRFMPGLGQFYNRRWLSGLVYAGFFIAVMTLFRNTWLQLLAAPVVIISIRAASAFAGNVLPVLMRIAVAILVTINYLPYPVIFRSYLFEVFRIDGGAMKPALLPNDQVVLDKLLYRFSEIKRGEIHAFRAPDRPGKYYVKRIAGLPGETIEIREGKVLINGGVLKSGMVVDEIPYLNYGPYGQPGQKVSIPEDSYYFLGDRLKNSLDSRFYGPIRIGEFTGKVIKIVRPGHRAGQVH